MRSRIVFAAIAVALLFAIAVRITPLRPSRAYYTRLDRAPGYALLPTYSFEDVNSTVNIDPNGHRVVDQHGSPASAPVVHVVGGKRVFGLNFDEETIAARLATHLAPHFRVENDGVPGYGPFADADVAMRFPTNDYVVVVLDEADDLRLAYGPDQHFTVHCANLVRTTAISAHLPCPVADFVTSVQELRPRFRIPAAIVPINDDAASRFAARVLAARTWRLLTPVFQRFGPHALVTYLPWAGAVNTRYRALYHIKALTSNATIADDGGAAAALRENARDAYAKDGELNARGVDIVANALATEVGRRSSLAGAPVAPGVVRPHPNPSPSPSPQT